MLLLPAQKYRLIVADFQLKNGQIGLIETENSQWLILPDGSPYLILLYPAFY